MQVAPKRRLSLSNAKRRSGRLVRAIGMAPAWRRRATSVASAMLEGVYRDGDTITVDAHEGVLSFR